MLERHLQLDSLRSSLTSLDLILGTTQMHQYKNFLPLLRLAFETWVEKTGRSVLPSPDQPDQASLLANTVEEYILLLFLTLCDWIAPNMGKAVEFVENSNFWHFEQLVLMIHDAVVWPCSSYVLSWTERIGSKSEEGAKSKISKILDFLLQLASPYANSLVFSSIQSIAMGYTTLSRPTILEEMDMADTVDANWSKFSSSAVFYIPNFSRTAASQSIGFDVDSTMELSRPASESTDPQESENTIFPNFLAKSGRNLRANSSALSFVSLREQRSSLSFIIFSLQDALLGDYLHHDSWQGLTETLAQIRSNFNESITSFLANTILAFLIIDRDQSKAGSVWYRARAGLTVALPKFLRFFSKSTPNPASLEKFLPCPPPSYATSFQHCLSSALHTVIMRHENAFMREVEQQAQYDTGAMNLSAQISLLPDLLSILGHSHLLSYSSLQDLMQHTGREEIRVLLEEPIAKTWIFDPHAETSALSPDFSALIGTLKSSNTTINFTNALQEITQEICGGPFAAPLIDTLLMYISSNEVEMLLEGEMDASEQENQESATFGVSKLAILLEYLSYSPVLEILTIAVPIESWILSSITRLVRLEKALESNSGNFGEISAIWANFSATILFLLNLLSTTRYEQNPNVKSHLIDIVRRFSHTTLAPKVQVQSLGDIDFFSEIDDTCASNQLPYSSIIEFLYFILVDENETPGIAVSPERLLSLLLNSSPNSEICSFTPWQWVLSAKTLADACVKFMCVRGANEERYDLLYPLMEAIHWISSKIPALRPLILRSMLQEYVDGPSYDINQVVHSSYLPTIVPDLILRWIHYPMLSHGVVPGDFASFARLVCISNCKELLWRVLQRHEDWRLSDWGQALEPLVQPDVNADPSTWSHLLPSSNLPADNNGDSAKDVSNNNTNNPSAPIDRILSAIIQQPEEQASQFALRTALVAISSALMPTQVVKSILKQLFSILSSDPTETSYPTNNSTSMDIGSASIGNTSSSTRTEAQTMAIAEKLAFCLAHHCFSSSPSPTAVVVCFLDELLPCILQRVSSPRTMQFLAHFTFFVLISSSSLRTTCHAENFDSLDSNEHSKIDIPHWTSTGRPEMLSSLHSIFILLLHVGRVALTRGEDPDLEELKSILSAPITRTGGEGDAPIQFFALLLSRMLAYTPFPMLFQDLLLPFIEALIANDMSSTAITLAISPGSPVSALSLPVWRLLCTYYRDNSGISANNTAGGSVGPDLGEPTPLQTISMEVNDQGFDEVYSSAKRLPVIEVIKLR